jgi:hypothetical protein
MRRLGGARTRARGRARARGMRRRTRGSTASDGHSTLSSWHAGGDQNTMPLSFEGAHEDLACTTRHCTEIDPAWSVDVDDVGRE